MWTPLYDDLKDLLLPETNELEVVQKLKEISKNFTFERSKINSYTMDAFLSKIYTLYYLPTNIPKLYCLINRLPKHVQKNLGDYNFIDVGSGPGTYALAWAHLFSPKEITIIEKSPHMRDITKILFQKYFPSIILNFSENMAKKEKSILFFGNSFNEMDQFDFEMLQKKQNPEMVMMIEPGTPEVFQQILKLRTQLIQQDFNLIYPCPSNGTCPLEGQTQNWCHQYVHAIHDQAIERLSQLLGFNRHEMPICSFVFSKNKASCVTSTIFRTYPTGKASVELELCIGEQPKLKLLEVLRRDLDKKMLKEIEKLRAGDRIVFSLTKEITEKKIRGKLVQEDQ
jgi:ribosomal protein RSM22 (predicted rRNA methylase)